MLYVYNAVHVLYRPTPRRGPLRHRRRTGENEEKKALCAMVLYFTREKNYNNIIIRHYIIIAQGIIIL